MANINRVIFQSCSLAAFNPLHFYDVSFKISIHSILRWDVFYVILLSW